jgi:serine/threonine-protein kinase HipA
MSCLGCYRHDTEGYCLSCRKQLFDGARIPAMLDFDAPRDTNVAIFQEQVKRLSISGVQMKYSLKRTGNTLELTEKGGQYILKPIPPSLIAYPDQAPENERLTMQIAARVFKIDTASNALIYFRDRQPAYLTRRFDLAADHTKYLQEDFAQISGRTRNSHGDNFKYDGTYEEIGLLIRQHVAAYMPAVEAFFRLVVFNYLLSNGDAHMKNFSLLYTGEEYRLTPAYDLMCTVLHTPTEADTALDLFAGDIDTPYYAIHGHYGYEHFMELARRIGIVEKRAAKILSNMNAKEAQVTQLVTGSLLTDELKTQYLAAYLDKLRRMRNR